MAAGEMNPESEFDTARLGNRMSRLEGAYEHLATKADLKDLELRLTLRILIIAVDRLWT